MVSQVTYVNETKESISVRLFCDTQDDKGLFLMHVVMCVLLKSVNYVRATAQ